MKDDEQVFPFALVPSEVVMDKRLTLEAMRVLVTLYSFRNKNTGLTCPSRESISERCGMHPSNISDATTKLVELGWLRKNGGGGHSKATRYDIHIPEIVAEQATLNRAKIEERKRLKVAQQATVVDSATIAQQAIPDEAAPASPQIAAQTTRKEQTNLTDHLTLETFLFGVCPTVARDFLKLRKDRKAMLTETAMQGFIREAKKANVSLETALRTCCEQTWTGFRADWYNKITANTGTQKPAKFDPVAYVNRNAIKQGGPIEKLVN